MSASTMPDGLTGRHGSRSRLAATALAWCVVAIAAANGFLTSWLVLRNTAKESDLYVYVGAVRAASHQSLYDFATPGIDHKLFTYPPFSALLFYPASLVPDPVLQFMWPIATLLAGAAIGTIMAPRLAPRLAHYWPADDWRRTPVLPLAITVVVLSGPVSSNLVFGQVSLFIALLVLLDVRHFVPDRYQGIATGIAAAIKLTPLIFIPYLWLAGRRRAAVTSMITFVACGIAGWALHPTDSVRYWLVELWRFDRVAPAVDPGNQSMNGILARAGLTGMTEKALWIVLCVTIVVLALYRSVRADRNGHPFLAVAIVGAASVCVSPISWEHHTIWVVLAAVGLVWTGARKQLLWPFIVVIVMLTLRPYALMTYEWLPVIVTHGLVSSEALLALLVACVVPFHEIRKPQPRPESTPTQIAEVRG